MECVFDEYYMHTLREDINSMRSKMLQGKLTKELHTFCSFFLPFLSSHRQHQIHFIVNYEPYLLLTITCTDPENFVRGGPF